MLQPSLSSKLCNFHQIVNLNGWNIPKLCVALWGETLVIRTECTLLSQYRSLETVAFNLFSVLQLRRVIWIWNLWRRYRDEELTVRDDMKTGHARTHRTRSTFSRSCVYIIQYVYLNRCLWNTILEYKLVSQSFFMR